MKLNCFLLLCLIPVAVSVLSTVPHRYELIMSRLTWADAQNVCRTNYTDLAIILSDTDWLRFNKVVPSASLISAAWVGLYNDINSWHWSLNKIPLGIVPTYWYPGQPDNFKGRESCVLMGLASSYAWWDQPCTDLHPFVCYDANLTGAAKFIGISTPMTWSDAQAYCRTHYTDMASAFNSSDNNLIGHIRDVQSDSWFGLYRDTWKWADGSNTTNLQWASGQPDNAAGNENCGVIYNDQFSDVPCNSLYGFICHTSFPTRSQTVRVQVVSAGNVFDAAVQSSILQQIEEKLEENGMLVNTTVTWKVQPDGKIFQKKKKNEA